MLRYFLLLLCVAAVVFFLWKNLAMPKTAGLLDGNLQPCPKSPNCVSCLATDREHYIAPLPLTADNTLGQIENYLTTHYDTTVIAKTPTYMHVVVTTKVMRFKDDVEFLVEKDAGLICVRSASRVGYSDLNTNRQRIEDIRAFLKGTRIH